MLIRNILAMTLLLVGCQKSQVVVQPAPPTVEPIYRLAKEHRYQISDPIPTPRELYPWEHHISRITKEFFRCKGDSSHACIVGENQNYTDCEGGQRHGLPMVHGREGVYPILLKLLNHLQKETQKKVVITSGHRCPTHNMYVDSSKSNRCSRHQIGAEVNFYVEGMEEQPEKVVKILMDYYASEPEFAAFRQTQQTWTNREIKIQWVGAKEGRDVDNQHGYPYLILQVLYDRDLKEAVYYDWNKANIYPRSI